MEPKKERVQKWNAGTKDIIARILKSVGVIGSEVEAELPLDQIRAALDLNKPLLIRNECERAVARQIDNDEKSGRNSFKREISAEYTALYTVLAGLDVNGGAAKLKAVLNEANAKKLLAQMCGNITNATDIVMAGLVTGIPDQDGVKETDAEEAALVLTSALHSDYVAYLKAHPDLDETSFPPERFKEQKTIDNITKDLASVVGSTDKAEKILAEAIDENNPSFRDTAHFKAAKERVNALRPGDKVRAADLLMSFAETITKAQVTAFYENRIEEQNTITAQGQHTKRGDATRIEATLGAAGKKATEELIGQKLKNNMVVIPKVNPRPTLPEHKWRGYQKLAELVTKTVKGMYAGIQTTGFVERLMGKNNKMERIAPNNKYRWDTQYQAMPAEYYQRQLDGTVDYSLAAAFFTRAQARLISDKVSVTTFNQALEKGLKENNLCVEDLDVYQQKLAAAQNSKNPDAVAAVQNDEYDRLIQLRDQRDYCEMRIESGEDALKRLQETVAQSPDKANDNILLDHLETGINLLETRPFENETPMAYDERCHQRNMVAAKPNLEEFILNDSQTETPQFMVNALRTFLHANDSTEQTEHQASYLMVADILGLRDKFDREVINQNDLENLMQNAAAGKFNPDIAQSLIDGLQNGTISPEECRSQLHQAATDFLQRTKYQAATTNTNLNQMVAENIKNL